MRYNCNFILLTQTWSEVTIEKHAAITTMKSRNYHIDIEGSREGTSWHKLVEGAPPMF